MLTKNGDIAAATRGLSCTNTRTKGPNVLAEMASKFVSRLKGDQYSVDPAIEGGYLLNTLLLRAVMKLRGIARIRQGMNSPFIGSGVQCRARAKIRFGKNVTLDHDSFIDAQSTQGVSLGDNVTLGRGSRIECTGSLKYIGVGFAAGSNVGLGTDNFYGAAGGIVIGDDTIIGNFTSFHSENHVHEDLETPIRLQGVVREGIRIGPNCWIGARVTVLDGVNLGHGSIVAAGAVLKAGDYASNGVYAGVPARLVRIREVRSSE